MDEEPPKYGKVLLNSLEYFFDNFNVICLCTFIVTDIYLIIDATQLHILL